MRRLATVVLVLMLGAGSVFARELVNVDKAGVALAGHDPVAFFTEGKAVPGQAGISARHGGAIYRFSSEANRARFEKEPTRYLPAFGGFCAYGASKGYAASVEIDTWQIHQGRLLLNYNQEVKARFDADRDRLLEKADANWPGIVEKEGK